MYLETEKVLSVGRDLGEAYAISIFNYLGNGFGMVGACLPGAGYIVRLAAIPAAGKVG